MPERASKIGPERQLLLCCARTGVDDESADAIRTLLRAPLRWPEVMAAALEHHVEPLLYENLKDMPEKLVPRERLEEFREKTVRAGESALQYFGELLRIQEMFDREHVPLVPYKGPVLSLLAYRNPTRRRFADLDFFVEQKNIPRATELLKSLGLQANFGLKEEQAGPSGYAPGQYSFSRNYGRVHVELHTERTLRYFPVALDFSKMRGRLLTLEVGGRTVRTFSVEDTLVMLCVHGAKHFWERLSWLVDVAELVAAQPVDWQLALRIAEKLKSRRLLLLGLYLAHELLDAPLPQFVLDRARGDSSVQWLANQIYEQFANATDPSAGIRSRAVFRIRSRDGFWQGIRHVVKLGILPTEKDRQTVTLPNSLSFFYFLVRPWRLLREYGIGFRRRP